ncbi:MAG: Rieske 2Fe-2S domain-containing protein [Acidimicrobiales bacterium]|nr:Rieske 2Fe-2S domain-containing protein [Acidimicrobiales bacterium]
MTTSEELTGVERDGHYAGETAGRLPPGRNPRHFGIDPGEPWPDDVPMDQDDTHWRFENDPKAAKRAENRIAVLFVLTLLSSAGLAWDYISNDGQTQVAAACFGVGLAALAVGLILMARDLMPGNEVTASRGHHHVSEDPDRVAVAESLARGIEPFARRAFLLKVLAPVGGAFSLALLFPIASLGPRPHRDLLQTKWGRFTRAVNQDGQPIRPNDLPVDGILTVFPEGYMDDALSPTLLINVGQAPFRIVKGNEGYNIGGIVAFSAICTHAACPAKLYNTQTHQLICPCHQSTFDVLDNAKPVFGPAPRSLPQLPLTVDAEGYIVSQSDYTQPVGPGFWNRG